MLRRFLLAVEDGDAISYTVIVICVRIMLSFLLWCSCVASFLIDSIALYVVC